MKSKRIIFALLTLFSNFSRAQEADLTNYANTLQGSFNTPSRHSYPTRKIARAKVEVVEIGNMEAANHRIINKLIVNSILPINQLQMRMVEPMVSAAAASTSRIKLGTTVSVLSTDEPICVFQQLATAAALAPGRIDVVAGRGSSAITFQIFDLDESDYDTCSVPS